MTIRGYRKTFRVLGAFHKRDFSLPGWSRIHSPYYSTDTGRTKQRREGGADSRGWISNGQCLWDRQKPRALGDYPSMSKFVHIHVYLHTYRIYPQSSPRCPYTYARLRHAHANGTPSWNPPTRLGNRWTFALHESLK